MWLIGKAGKTRIFVETSFLILAGLFVVLAIDDNVPLGLAMLWIPIIFVSILVHELGHAAAIGMFGFGASEVVLGGFGGSTMNRHPRTPWQQIAITLAGPLSSALLGGVFYFLVEAGVAPRQSALMWFLAQMTMVNLFWAVFNLLPIRPLDGGQIAGSFLQLAVGPQRSFVWMTWFSIALAAGLAVFMLVVWKSIFNAIIAANLAFYNYQLWIHHRQPPEPPIEKAS